MQCPSHMKRKLTPISMKNGRTCDLCGRQANYECVECQHLQCGECRICTKYHQMLKIIDLKTVKAEYHNNNYVCDACGKTKKVDDDGIWHCYTCNYGVCPECSD